MIRGFRIDGVEAPDVMHKARVDMVTGMGVIKEDSTTGKFANIASVETITDIFIVDRERVPSGIDYIGGDMSGYDNDFVKVKANEPVPMDRYHAGEKFGADQYDDTITSDLALSTRVSQKNGFVTKAAIASPYTLKGFHNDNRHSLAQVEVSDTVTSNAQLRGDLQIRAF